MPRISRLWLRLTLICVGTAALPTLIGGLVIADRVEHHSRATTTAELSRMVVVATEQTDRHLSSALDKLRALADKVAQLPAVTDLLPEDPARLAVLDRLRSQVDPPGLFLGLEYTANANTAPLAVQQIALPEPAATPAATEAVERQPIAAYGEQRFGRTTVALTVVASGHQGANGTLTGYLDLRELRAVLRPLSRLGHGFTITDAAGTPLVTCGDWLEATAAEIAAAELPATGWYIEARGSRANALVTADAARRQTWGVTLVASVIATLLALLVAFWLVRPIQRLTQAASAMAGGDLTTRAGLQRRDEIGELGAAFDRMATAVQQLDAARSNFVGTVSHELRTPLTSLRANVQNLTDGIHGTLTPAQQDATERLAGEVVRLQTIVDDTLTLSRLEAGAEPCRATACDLHELALAAVEERQQAARERDITVEIRGAGSAHADAQLLRRALTNLLDNAIRHAPAVSTVTIDLAPHRLAVRDHGPGFTIEDPFAPFAQGSTEGRKNPGVGLGLAIVQRIVKLHGGSIDANSDDGAVVTIRLPETR